MWLLVSSTSLTHVNRVCLDIQKCLLGRFNGEGLLFAARINPHSAGLLFPVFALMQLDIENASVKVANGLPLSQ